MVTHDEFSASLVQNALAIFCRAPRLGTVKTRLTISIGNEFTLELYTAMLRDSFALGSALAPDVDAFAGFTPADAFEGENSLQNLWNGRRLAQCEGNLGLRMLDCFRQLREQGYQKIALIGSDSPDLSLAYLQQAFELLGRSQITLGPSQDGGFYLIGASTALPDEIFDGITWSSASVLAQLQANLKRLDLTSNQLPSWRDVDDESDLEALWQRLNSGHSHAPHTHQLLIDQF